jgi:hypothetical protein
LPSTGHGKGDQEKHDSNDTDDVRYHGDPTGDIARIGPDEANHCSHDEQSEHRGKPVQNPSSIDAPSLLAMEFRQSFRQALS